MLLFYNKDIANQVPLANNEALNPFIILLSDIVQFKNQSFSMFKIAFKYGLLIVVFLFLWVMLEYAVGLHAEYIRFHPLATLVSLVIPLIFLYYGIRESQKNYIGHFTYGKAFQVGLYITLVVTILSPLGQWLIHVLIFPGYFESMQPHTQAQDLAQGIDPEVARREGTGVINLWDYLLKTALGYLVAGIVMSAILAIFVRDKALPKGR